MQGADQPVTTGQRSTAMGVVVVMLDRLAGARDPQIVSEDSLRDL